MKRKRFPFHHIIGKYNNSNVYGFFPVYQTKNNVLIYLAVWCKELSLFNNIRANFNLVHIPIDDVKNDRQRNNIF